MASLDDQLYQLFSELLKNSKQRDGLSFNGHVLPTGDGPFRINSEGQETLYLGPRSTLLGYGHPLTFKTSLQSSLSPEIFCSERDQVGLLKEINSFLQKVTGKTIYATFSAPTGIETYDAGRHSNFLSEKTLVYLYSGKIVLIPNLFPFPIYLHNTSRPENSSLFLSQSSLTAAKATLKLLQLGDFYGDKGHIQRISQELKAELSHASCVKEVEGLLIYLEQDRNYSFLDEGQHIIYLPLFFRPTFIKELKNFIME